MRLERKGNTVNARLACCALMAWILSFDVLSAEPVPSRDWRPVHASEIALPVIPLPFWAASTPDPRAGSAQWIQIDPVSGRIVPGRIPVALRPAMQAEPLQPMELRLNSAGYLYLDTRGYQSVVTMQLAPDGSMHTNCTEVSHQHDQGAPHVAPSTTPTGEHP